jgi:hypothetical protein
MDLHALIPIAISFIAGCFTVVAVQSTMRKPFGLRKVANKDKRATANMHYWYGYLEHRGKRKPFLFTDSGIKQAHKRALKNEEDYKDLK